MLNYEQICAIADQPGGSLRLKAAKAGIKDYSPEDALAVRAEIKERNNRISYAPRNAKADTKPKVTAPLATSSMPPKGSPMISQIEASCARDAAAGMAKAKEQARWAKVFASPHAKGRENAATTLLQHPKGWSAEAIIGHLADEPADQARSAANPAAQARSNAVWDRAHGVASEAAEAKVETPVSNADVVWERAYGAAAAEAPKATGSNNQLKADDVWGRIYGSKQA
jgi:hypothetical protein